MPDELGLIRDERGRIMKGSTLRSPGRPRTPPDAPKRLKRAVAMELTDEKLRELIKTHIDRGKAGSVASARLILEYAIGKPRERVDVDVTARGALWAFIQEVRSAGEDAAPQVIEGETALAPSPGDEEPGE